MTAHQDAVQRLERARTALADPSLHLTSALEKYSPALSNLGRHQAALSKSVRKNLSVLHWLQAARAAEPVSAAEADDQNVDLGHSDGEYDRS